MTSDPMRTTCDLNTLLAFAAGALSCLLGACLGARIILRHQAGETGVLRSGKGPWIDQDHTD